MSALEAKAEANSHDAQPARASGPSQEVITLRGHQVLCLLGFRGLGYSPAFVDNMSRIFRRLIAQEGTPLRLVSGPADLCGPCPHRGPAGCQATNSESEGERGGSAEGPPGRSEGRMGARDRAVLARLEIGEGQVLPWREVKGRIAGALGPQDLQALCGSCPWLPYGYCVGGLRRLQAAAEGLSVNGWVTD